MALQVLTDSIEIVDGDFVTKEEFNTHATDSTIHITEDERNTWNNLAPKATTLEGYGITDAYTKTESDNRYDSLGAAAERVKSVSKKDNSIDLTGTKEVSIGVKLSETANNQLSLQPDGLYVPPAPEQTDYSVTVTESTPEGYAKAYTLTQDGTSIGTINIPKDLVVESGTVETNPTGQPEGTYLVLTLANTTSDKIYINVGSLIEYVTSGSATSDSVQIVIDGTTHKVTAYIKDGTVTKAKLDSSVQSSLDKADSSLSTTGDATNVTNTITTANTRANLVSGETLGISLGKIRKWFNDLTSVAFSGSYNDLSNKPSIPSSISELTNDSSFLTYTSQSLLSAQKAQARTNIGAGTGDGNCSSIVVNNVSVATSAWGASSTYTDYPYEASVTVTGCTTNHVPEVVFSPTDASSGIFAPVCSSTTNAVIIYATEKPSAAITILTIECRQAL